MNTEQRQDHVDNSIWNLLTDIIPDEFHATAKGVDFESWNIELIGTIRDHIETSFADLLPEDERARFLAAFYPPLEPDGK